MGWGDLGGKDMLGVDGVFCCCYGYCGSVVDVGISLSLLCSQVRCSKVVMRLIQSTQKKVFGSMFIYQTYT